MKRPRKKAVRWSVYFFRRRAARLDIIEATDQHKALKKAIKQFDTPLQDRRRISVQRE
jgi:hypothetical protein